LLGDWWLGWVLLLRSCFKWVEWKWEWSDLVDVILVMERIYGERNGHIQRMVLMYIFRSCLEYEGVYKDERDAMLASWYLILLTPPSFIPFSRIPNEYPQTPPTYHLPSLHPTGTNAAATLPTPLSVASKLNIAAAFPVSPTSTLTPIPPSTALVSGATGTIAPPTPKINRSGFGHTILRTPHAASPVSHWPLLFKRRFWWGVASQGRQAKAWPEMRRRPVVWVSFMPEERWKPVGRQASMLVVGGGWGG